MDLQYKKATLFIFTLVLITLLVISKCTADKYMEKSARLEKNIEALHDTIKYKQNAIGTITASKKAIETTVKELKKEVWIKDEKINKLTKDFSNLQSVSKITTTVTIPEIKVVYKDSVRYVFERRNEVREQWYSFDAKSDQKGFTITDFKLQPNISYIILGQKRDGLFKPAYWTTEVTNTNPYFKTTDIQIQVIQEKTPFYNKWWFRAGEIALGFAAGVKAAK